MVHAQIPTQPVPTIDRLHDALKDAVPALDLEVLSIAVDSVHLQARVDLSIPCSTSPDSEWFAQTGGQIFRGLCDARLGALRIDIYQRTLGAGFDTLVASRSEFSADYERQSA